MGCGVDQTKGCVCTDAEAGDICVCVNAGQDFYPRFDVTALEGPYLCLVGVAEASEVPVLDTDDIRITEGEIDLELDEPFQRGPGIFGLRYHPQSAVQQVTADA